MSMDEVVIFLLLLLSAISFGCSAETIMVCGMAIYAAAKFKQ